MLCFFLVLFHQRQIKAKLYCIPRREQNSPSFDRSMLWLVVRQLTDTCVHSNKLSGTHKTIRYRADTGQRSDGACTVDLFYSARKTSYQCCYTEPRLQRYIQLKRIEIGTIRRIRNKFDHSNTARKKNPIAYNHLSCQEQLITRQAAVLYDVIITASGSLKIVPRLDNRSSKLIFSENDRFCCHVDAWCECAEGVRWDETKLTRW